MTDRIAQIQARLDAMETGTGYEDMASAQHAFETHAPEDVAFLLAEVERLTTANDRLARIAAWDAGYAAAILDIGNEFEPSSTNPWLGGEDGER